MKRAAKFLQRNQPGNVGNLDAEGKNQHRNMSGDLCCHGEVFRERIGNATQPSMTSMLSASPLLAASNSFSTGTSNLIHLI